MSEYLTAARELGLGYAEIHPRVASPGLKLWQLVRIGTDVSLLVLGSVAAGLGSAHAGLKAAPYAYVAFVLLAMGLFGLRGLYARRIRPDLLDEVRRIVATTLLAAMILLTSLLILGTVSDEALGQAMRLGVFAAVYVGAGRIALGWVQKEVQRRGDSFVPTLIVGAGAVGQLTARRLVEHPEFGFRPVGYLDKEPLEQSSARGAHLPVLGASWDFDDVAERYGVRQVIITFSTAPSEVLLRMVKRCEARGIGVALVPRLFEKMTDRLTVEHLGGLPLLIAHPSDPKGWQFAVKYALDRVVAAALIVLTSPLLAAAALAVRISMGRPIFFRQLRVGRDGRVFEMLKFRSMRLEAPDSKPLELLEDTAPGGVEGDDRRTKVGAILRQTSIDELPQLFNVLRGDMSIIGPRPERPEFVELFGEHVYRYGERHRVKSGITGWAQVHGLRGKTSLTDRVEWDNYYIENWSLWLDLKILVLTVATVLSFFSRVE
jgi:exopolysaccharide biosynthesis polyprenyl glycosylphosphotransferase